MDDERWVDARLEMLDPAAGWRPDAAQALHRVRARERAVKTARRRYITVAAVAVSLAGVAMLVVPLRQKCTAANCTDRTASPARSFKESGAGTAAVTCEIYTDYQCPSCARLYAQTIPLLMAQYVDTGKVRLLHRDLPLSAHAYALLAARYANAAGPFGHYDAVMSQIFKTQALWSVTGDIDSQVARVLPPNLMDKVRDLVQHDPRLDDTVAADVAMAREDQITETPSLVIVSKGKREVIAGIPDFTLLKSYLDRVLAK